MAGDGRRNCGEARYKFCEEEGDAAVTAEQTLCFAYAGAGLKRKPADEADDLATVADTGEVPHAVGDGAGCENRTHDGQRMQAVRGGESSRGDEERHRGHWDAHLLDEHPQEEDAVGVVNEEFDAKRHIGDLCW